MAATVTNLQNALKALIDAVNAAAWSVPITTRIADDDVADPPAVGDPAEVLIGFEASARIGQTVNRSLEQLLMPIIVRRRYPTQDQTSLAALHLLTEQLRDLVSAFNAAAVTTTVGAVTTVSDAQRVEQILSPHPFDQPQSRSPGLFTHKFVADCDVVRTLSVPAATAIDPKPLPTKTREAVWDAIDNWPAFAGAWTRKFKAMADVEELSLHDPGRGDLSALAVTWGPTNPEWWVNTMQQWNQQLFVTFWLPGDQLDVAELRLLQLMQAIYQSAPVDSPTVSYIRRAVGRPPSKNQPVTLEQVAIGRSQQLKVWQGTIALNLTANLDPND